MLGADTASAQRVSAVSATGLDALVVQVMSLLEPGEQLVLLPDVTAVLLRQRLDAGLLVEHPLVAGGPDLPVDLVVDVEVVLDVVPQAGDGLLRPTPRTVTTSTPRMTLRDRPVLISTTPTGLPSLMNGTLFSCRACSTSLTPMKPRIAARP